MRTHKCLKQAINMVLHSRLRSWLTILGIVIGVGSVIAIMSLGAGMQASINDRLGGFGADLITLSAGSSRGMRTFGGPGGDEGGGGGGATASDEIPQIDRADLQALRGIPDIAYILPTISGRVDVYYLGKRGSVSLTGVDQKTWAQVTTDVIRDGRLLGPADQNVVVIGARLADGYFDSPLGINKMFTIEDRAFRVVGVLDDQSTSVYMPLQTAYYVIPDKEQDVYDSITIKIKDESRVLEMTDKIDKKLMMTHHVTNKTKDFSVRNNVQTSTRIQDTISAMTLFLTAIAAVSLLVGAVGIANTMFTSVLEKTKDIGIMKAIGARNRDIMKIFLFNSGLIGLIGGLLGVMLGSFVSGFMPYLVPNMRGMGGTTVITANSVIGSLLVALVIGMIAGVIPAYQASKLKPVDALRYE
ncbi:MAG: ABC transporter permease [Candidatus Woesearchaeota archaeon]